MDNLLRERLERIQAKCTVLRQRMSMQSSALVEAQDDIKRLKRAHDDDKRLIARLESELSYARMATAAGGNIEERKLLQQTLTELVREIDCCINDLKH